MTDTVQTESRRDRVRRLFITPLIERGFRFRKGTAPDAQRACLDRIADELGYLGDDALRLLLRWAETAGEGAARCFWPPFVTIASVANAFQSRPVEELPELASWFGSRIGPDLLQSSALLVMHLRFIEAKRRPPTFAGEPELVQKRADTLHADAARARELRDCNRPFDAPLLARFEADLARAVALVNAGVTRRAIEAQDRAGAA